MLKYEKEWIMNASLQVISNSVLSGAILDYMT